jgi:hypothetical protein
VRIGGAFGRKTWKTTFRAIKEKMRKTQPQSKIWRGTDAYARLDIVKFEGMVWLQPATLLPVGGRLKQAVVLATLSTLLLLNLLQYFPNGLVIGEFHRFVLIELHKTNFEKDRGTR